MPVSDRVAILLDGEFVKKALGVFYYTAELLCRTAIHPLDATVIDFAKTSVFLWRTSPMSP